MKTWFTADSHLGHANIIRFCNRPFNDVDEMDTKLIENWNSKVGPKDEVYHLGDFAFRSKYHPNIYKNELNGKIHLIFGNHDKKNLYGGFNILPPQTEIKINNISITLNHFAMRVWNKSHHGAWHLYGHSHGTLEPIGLSLDVGVDSHNYFPWSFEEIQEFMNQQPQTQIIKH